MAAPIVIIGMSRSGTTLVGAPPRVAARACTSRPSPTCSGRPAASRHLADDVVEDDARAAALIRHTLLVGRRRAHARREVAGQLPATRPRAPRLPRRAHRLRRARRRALHRLELPAHAEAGVAEAVDRAPQVPARRRARAGDFGAHLDATGGRSLRQQIRPRDWLPFACYTARLLWLRQTKGPLPFGPEDRRASSRSSAATARSPTTSRCYRIAQERKARFEELYGDRLATLPARGAAIRSRRDRSACTRFCGFPVDRSRIDATIEGFDPELVDARVASRARTTTRSTG